LVEGGGGDDVFDLYYGFAFGHWFHFLLLICLNTLYKALCFTLRLWFGFVATPQAYDMDCSTCFLVEKQPKTPYPPPPRFFSFKVV
jgi:hypothetical protein